MVANEDTAAVRRYHDGTKHSFQSVRQSRHFLDWTNQPLAFKIYRELDSIPLPRTLEPSGGTALAALAGEDARVLGAVDLENLARLAYFSAGVTRVRSYPGGEILFRAAACTGALYHVELYLACGAIPGLSAGLYHFSAKDFTLSRLREGDWRFVLAEATGGEPAVTSAGAVWILTSTYWRNSWKYQARAYRHVYWDSGTLLANLLAVAAARGVPARLVLGFVDRMVNRLLGVDSEKEVAVALVALGTDGPTVESPRDAAAIPAIPAIEHPTEPLSHSELDYPAIREMHAASCLMTPDEAAGWRGRAPVPSGEAVRGSLFPLAPIPESVLRAEPIEEVIRRRGSSRRFAREPISFAELSTALDRATRGISADFLEFPGALLTVPFVIVNAVVGLPPGAYVYRREHGSLEQIKEGDFRRQAGYLALGQDLGADAAADVYLLCDLEPVLARLGNRGYRAAQLEGGILGGRLYLGAYALGFGATGLTFYDDEVTDFLSPPARGKSVMFLCALGRPFKRRG